MAVKMLPGENVATNPACMVEKTVAAATPPAIIASTVIGFIST